MTSKVKRPARPLAQLNRVERHIKKQVQMSKVIDHLYAEHNDQLEFTHKQAEEGLVSLEKIMMMN
jgi:Uri superfamily endonuclease